MGVISLYKSQSQRIKAELDNSNVPSGSCIVSTVDAFQGGEKDVILLSTVRANGKTVGFTDDHSRLNVALSRAKRNLIIFGNCDTLSNSATWRSVVDYCKSVGMFIDGKELMTMLAD
eukprot:Partr_v1_DN28607_c3_g1_i5_m49575 putative tRNA-splicing endonuclease positive